MPEAWLVTDYLLFILIQYFIYKHIIIVDRDFLTQLLFEGQGNGVGLSLGLSDAAPQVGVIEALPSSQTFPQPVKTQAWHQDQVQTSWKMRADGEISDEGLEILAFACKYGQLYLFQDTMTYIFDV